MLLVPFLLLLSSLPSTYVNRHKLVYTVDDHTANCNKTLEFLRIFRKYKIKATFFVNTDKIYFSPKSKSGRRAYLNLKKIHKEGHLIANHSLSHKNMCKLSAKEILTEIRENSKIIKKVTGYYPKYFRPPYGYICLKLRKEVKRLKLKLVWWHLDDYTTSLAQMKYKLLKRIKRGYKKTILLFHCKPRYLERFIKWVKNSHIAQSATEK